MEVEAIRSKELLVGVRKDILSFYDQGDRLSQVTDSPLVALVLEPALLVLDSKESEVVRGPEPFNQRRVYHLRWKAKCVLLGSVYSFESP